MRSIRRHLLLWLFPGFVLLLLGAGAAVYLALLKGLEAEMDRELRDLAGAIPFVEGAGVAGLNLDDFAEGDFGRFFQIWGADGVRWLKSENLGRFALEPPEKFLARGEFGEQVLGNGEAIRTLALRVPASESPSCGNDNTKDYPEDFSHHSKTHLNHFNKHHFFRIPMASGALRHWI
jgi:hypothetical protein